MNVVGLVVLLVAGLALFALAVTAFTAWTLTHPARRTYSWAVVRGIPGDPSEVRMPGAARSAFSSWTFSSRGMELPVWDVPGFAPAGPTAVITHGWGDSRVVALSRLPALLPCCRRIVMWDLPGHGDAPGVCTLGTREVEDLERLLERVGTDAPVLLYGSSLGAGVSIAVAGAGRTAAPIIGVIAEAPYRVPRVPAERVLSLRGLPHRWNIPAAMGGLGMWLGYGLSWVRRGRGAGGFDRVLHAARLSLPLLVLHGTEDEVCPIDDGRTIAAAVPDGRGRLVEVEGASHNNLWTEDGFIPVSAGAVAEFVGSLSLPISSAG
jgi:pimeloyl-ACP methyl ester carboxylesterase